MQNIFDLLIAGWLKQILEGAALTVVLSVGSFILALFIAMLFIAAKIYNLQWIGLLEKVYTVIFRGLPELLIIFFLYFVISDYLGQLSDYFNFSINHSWLGFGVGIWALGLISGCYLTEILRGALSAIPQGQIEAAKSVGMTKYTMLTRIIYPQIFAYGWNGIVNIWLLDLKDSSLVMVIGVAELMFKSNLAVTTTNMPFLFYGLGGLIYIIMAIISAIVFKKIANRRKYRLQAG